MTFLRFRLFIFLLTVLLTISSSVLAASLAPHFCEILAPLANITSTELAFSKQQRLELFFKGNEYLDQNILNDFSKVMGVHPKTKEGIEFYRTLYQSEIKIGPGKYRIGGLELKESDLLGEGFAAMVFKHPKDPKLVIKIPHSPEDISKIQMEQLVYEDLEKSLSTFQIQTLETNFLTDKKIALVKPKIDSQFLGSNMKSLSELQNIKLELLWENASRYAMKKGIGLDLKADNLYWDQAMNDWVLIDTGPRLSYRPFGFTSDQKSFADYLSTWQSSDPQIKEKAKTLEELRPKISLDPKYQKDYESFIALIKKEVGDDEIGLVSKRILAKLEQHHFSSPQERAKVYEKFNNCYSAPDFKEDCFYGVMQDLFISDYGKRAKARVLDYTETGYEDINDNLRLESPSPDITSINIKSIIHSERALNPERQLYRGTIISKRRLQSILESKGKDSTIIDKAFMSSSNSVSGALEFLEEGSEEKVSTMIMVKSKSYLDLRDVTHYPEESEFLIDSGHRLFIKKVMKASDYCKELGKELALAFETYLIFSCEDKNCTTGKSDWQDLAKRVCG